MDSMPQDRPGDSRALAAQAYLTEVSQRPVDPLRPSEMIKEITGLRRHLGQVLAALASRGDDHGEG